MEIADELGDRKQLFRKYRRQSLLLLVPFAAPIIAASAAKTVRDGRTGDTGSSYPERNPSRENHEAHQ